MPFFEEGAEGSDPGAGADHDDGLALVGGEFEMGRGLEEDFEGAVFGDAVGEVGGADAFASPTVGFVSDFGDGEMNFAGMGRGTGGDGVKPGSEFSQEGDEVGGGGPQVGKTVRGPGQEGDSVVQAAVRVLVVLLNSNKCYFFNYKSEIVNMNSHLVWDNLS